MVRSCHDRHHRSRVTRSPDVLSWFSLQITLSRDIFLTKAKLLTMEENELQVIYRTEQCTMDSRCFTSPYGKLAARNFPIRTWYKISESSVSSWISSCIRPEVDGGNANSNVRPDPERKPTLMSCTKSLKTILNNQTKISTHFGGTGEELYVRSEIFPDESESEIQELNVDLIDAIGKHGESHTRSMRLLLCPCSASINL